MGFMVLHRRQKDREKNLITGVSLGKILSGTKHFSSQRLRLCIQKTKYSGSVRVEDDGKWEKAGASVLSIIPRELSFCLFSARDTNSLPGM